MADSTNDEHPMPREVLDSPEMKAKAAKALHRARQSNVGRGSSAEDLEAMAASARSRPEHGQAMAYHCRRCGGVLKSEPPIIPKSCDCKVPILPTFGCRTTW